MKKVILLLMLLPLFSLAVAVEAKQTAQGTYFMPDAAEWKCCWKEIGQQFKWYKAAKKEGNLYEALKFSLYHFQKAWLFNNAAYAIIKKGDPHSREELSKAENYLLAAMEHTENIQPQYLGHKAKLERVTDRNYRYIKKRWVWSIEKMIHLRKNGK